MALSICTLTAAIFLSGAVAGVFLALAIGIRADDCGHRLTDEPRTRLAALTRSVLGVGVRTDFAAGNSRAKGE